MKLYQGNLSPFTTRCRLVVYAKGAEDQVSFEAPPGGLSSDEYKKINPTGKVPALALDDGTVLPESEVIAEYLNDVLDGPSLMPADALDRAKARLINRIIDTYVIAGMSPIFQELTSGSNNADVIAEAIGKTNEAMDFLEANMGDGYAVGDSLTLADGGALAACFFANAILPFVGVAEPLANRPALNAYWAKIQQDPIGGKLVGEIAAALKESMGG